MTDLEWLSVWTPPLRHRDRLPLVTLEQASGDSFRLHLLRKTFAALAQWDDPEALALYQTIIEEELNEPMGHC